MSGLPTHTPSQAAAEAVQHYMTVGQLREALAGYPDGTPLVVQSDAEGNDFHPLSSASWGWWRPDWQEPVSDEGQEGDDEPWEPSEEMLPVLFLEPM